MRRLLWIAVWLLLAALLWPEINRYRAEWELAQSRTRLDRALAGQDTGPAAIASVERVVGYASFAAAALPADARPPLLLGLSLILLNQGEQAETVLQEAIRNQGERPELTINLARARAQRGDEPAAQRAFLRTAWAAPTPLSTVPKDLRDALQAQVETLEAALAAGQLQAPPPLD